jgi:hypothetical protein
VYNIKTKGKTEKAPFIVVFLSFFVPHIPTLCAMKTPKIHLGIYTTAN